MTSLLVLGIGCAIGFGVLLVKNAVSLLPLGRFGFWMWWCEWGALKSLMNGA